MLLKSVPHGGVFLGVVNILLMSMSSLNIMDFHQLHFYFSGAFFFLNRKIHLSHLKWDLSHVGS